MSGKLTRDFFRLEAAGGIVLFVAAVLAVVVNNSDALAARYQALLHAPFALGGLVSHHSLTHWINTR